MEQQIYQCRSIRQLISLFESKGKLLEIVPYGYTSIRIYKVRFNNQEQICESLNEIKDLLIKLI